MLDRILNVTLPNNLFFLVHTNAASLIPSITPGMQGLTDLLGRQAATYERWMLRCSPWFALWNLAEAISAILNSARLLIPLINIRNKMKSWTHPASLVLKSKTWKKDLKKTSCSIPPPPPTIKLLQITKISKIGLLFLLPISKILTRNYTSPSPHFPQTSAGGTRTQSFPIPISNQITTRKIS